jgi:hypothetical protein
VNDGAAFVLGVALGGGAGLLGGFIAAWYALRVTIWFWRHRLFHHRREARDWKQTCMAWKEAAQARRAGP